MRAEPARRRTGAETYPGLCVDCARVRVITSRTGSNFYLCERSRLDPSFPRYPRLPVSNCRGYTHREDLHLSGK